MMRTRGLMIAAACVCLAMGPAACITINNLIPPSDDDDAGTDSGAPDDGGSTGGTGGDGGDCTPTAEICNGMDDDCDGVADDDDPDTQTFCEGVVVNAITWCGRVSNMWVCVPGKCNEGFSSCDGEPSNGCEPFCSCNECPDSGSDDGGADDAGNL